MSLLLLWACAQEPPDLPAPLPPAPPPALLVLERPDMVGSDGLVNGGELVSQERDLRWEIALGPGRYRLQLRGRSTPLQGEAGRVSLRVEGRALVSAELPAGPELHAVVADFTLEEPRRWPMQLTFDNDLYEGPGQDRNVDLDRLELLRLEGEDPERRAEGLRQRMSKADLLLISLDTVRADRIGAYGHPRPTSPHIDALAAQGSLLRRAWSASHWTAPSHATMLTGLHPEQHGVVDVPAERALPAEARTLAEAARAGGLATAAYTGGFLVTQALGMDRGFDRWVESSAPCEQQVPAALAWAEEQRGRWMLFFHTYEAHAPFAPEPRWLSLFWPFPALPGRAATDQFRRGSGAPSPAELAAMSALYEADLRQTDACVGALLAGLRQQGRDPLVVLTSDHGEELYEHRGWGHRRLYPEMLEVPLIFSSAAWRAEGEPVVDQISGAVDLVPTLQELLGLPGAQGLPGQSLVPALAGAPPRPALAWASSAVGGRWRALRSLEGDLIENDDGVRLYSKGPRGREDRWPLLSPAERAAWLGRLEAAEAGLAPVGRGPPSGWTDERLEGLRELGYLDR